MIRKLLLLAFTISSLISSAAPGDTTWVHSFDKTDMTWNGTYRDTAVFPDGADSYHRVFMYYTMGCASGGCSDWDYTTAIKFLSPTGDMDSTVLSVDTISTNPLVIDTTWNVFEVTDRFELGRVITPYGGYMDNGSNGFDNNWEMLHVFDVTDFVHLLKDTLAMEARYSGWSSGFSATVSFAFIEGTPARDIVSTQTVYHGSYNYIDPNVFNNQSLPEKTLAIDPNAVTGKIRFTPTGHGFVNALNCAEFCEKDYMLYVNQALVNQESMWRDDCGENPIFPQGGTWLYDRANWCPGLDAVIFETHLPSLSGSSLDIDIDVEVYNYTVPTGETPANYSVDASFVQYGDFNIQTDVAIEEIVAPSTDYRFNRYNPNGMEGIVEISNQGESPLTYAFFEYSIRGGSTKQYHWNGFLEYGEKTRVYLPLDQFNDFGVSGSPKYFDVTVSNPNNTNDQVAYNNSKSSVVGVPDIAPELFIIQTLTNSAQNETHWKLYNSNGDVLLSRDNLGQNTLYEDTVNLPAGSYMIHVEDRGENGLSWWANSDGSGYVKFKWGGFYNNTLQPDFGTEYRYYFTTSSALSEKEFINEPQLTAYPNPTESQVVIDGVPKSAFSYQWVDISGRVIQSVSHEGAQNQQLSLSTEFLAPGVYIFEIIHNSERQVVRLVKK